jgi:acyl-CoA synthetase (AMP-forming)/AMP-acid ligase II
MTTAIAGHECEPVDPDAVAVLLYTSGTTAEPKAAILRHRHLVSYVIGTVEYAGADPSQATLVSVPPYHIAGVANVTSNLYSGRRVMYLPAFDPREWLETVRQEEITHALVVPTMLARIVEHLGRTATADVPSLRTLAYGGSRMPQTVIERALELFPGAGFVNAYGLTETSSTIALLDPATHREAVSHDDPVVRARLSSAGRPVPGVEIEIRDPDGRRCAPYERGGLWVRGEQVSGEYRGRPASLDGWFDTRDRAWLDSEGFLFIEGRVDDTIIRGGENIAPAEIEDVLIHHPDIDECAVVGLADDEWGHRIAAAIVPAAGRALDVETVRCWARERLRGSRMPDLLAVMAELPRTETGKIIRRRVVEELWRLTT